MDNTITIRRYVCGCRHEYDTAGYVDHFDITIRCLCPPDNDACRICSDDPNDYTESTRSYEVKP